MDWKTLCQLREGFKERSRQLTEDVEDLNELLQAPYWTRAWIVQEFVLAKRILVFYGQTHMEEKDLIRLLKSTNS